MGIKTKLSTLWIVVMLKMIMADVLSAFVAFTDNSVLALPDNAKMMMTVFALIINLPIMMIYLSKSLSPKKNRIFNIIVVWRQSFLSLAAVAHYRTI